MKKPRDVDDAELERISGGTCSLDRPCWDCLPCPPPTGGSPRPEEVERDQEETLTNMEGDR